MRSSARLNEIAESREAVVRRPQPWYAVRRACPSTAHKISAELSINWSCPRISGHGLFAM